MTLSEIESILQELSARHQNLTEELLITLLASAGWEDKTIKEAVMLFKQNGGVFATKPKEETQIDSLKVLTPVAVSVPSPSTIEKPIESADMTFYQPDGTEEGKLPVFADTPTPKREVTPIVKNEAALVVQSVPLQPVEVASLQENNKEQEVRQPSTSSVIKVEESPQQTPVAVVQNKPQLQLTTEPQSLIVHNTSEIKSSSKQTLPPDNLPLLPFESSPHIWSFSKYKDVFHGETPPQPEEIKVISVMPQQKVVTPPVSAPVVVQAVNTPPVKDIEVVVEAVPLRKDDKPLVFLASIMLFAIIIILGYMYSNGRL